MNTVTLFDYDEPQEIDQWYSINDGVMGGISSGSLIQSEPGVARFIGRVSFENSGGFASVRTRGMAVSLTGTDGIELRVRGDGKKYKLRLKANSGPDGFCYEIPFHTKPDEWEQVKLSYEDAKGKFRGLKVPFVPALNPSKIKSLGFLISDKQEGPFRLDVDWIKAFRS